MQQQREPETYEDIGLTQMRQVIAQRMQQSKMTAPYYCIDVTADATALKELKAGLQKRLSAQDAKISFD